AGASPTQHDHSSIDRIARENEVIAASDERRNNGMGSPFVGCYVGQDRKNGEKYMPQLSQGGTTLPDRDYYLIKNDRNNAIKDAYRNYISTLFTLSGSSKQDAERYFNTIWEIESILAAAQKSRVEMRDPQATYNKFS